VDRLGAPEENNMPKVFLFSLRDKKPVPVTDDWYASGDPVFSDDGKYLLLVSSRDFKPTFGQGDFVNIYRDMSRVYLVMLSKDTPSPLDPRSDEVGKDEKKEKEAAAAASASPSVSPSPAAEKAPSPAKDEKKPDEPKKAVVVKVDLDGIQDRLAALKIAPADYSDVRMVGDRIFYLRRTMADDAAGDEDGNPGGPKSHLCSYNLEDRKETVHGDVHSYEITHDGKKMLVKIGKDYAVVDLPKDKLELKDEKAGKDFKLKLDGLDMQLDRQAEWAQIYHESWRQMRDFFYAPNMHGIDWKAQRDKYAALLPFVNHRNDLTYLVAELISELNIGHAYVGGGERPETPRIKLGLLGAEFSRDAATRAYRIDRILRARIGMRPPARRLRQSA
jgi:tricorn protease